MKTAQSYLYTAWKRLIAAYLLAALIGLATGSLLVNVGNIPPERIFEASTKRLSYALPAFDRGTEHGIDMGVLLFAWNSLGAMVTMSFIYTAALFDPDHRQASPRWLRKVFCGKTRMKLLCYLPGCAQIEAESLRRLYVWVMVPLLGILLLGVESGLQVSTATYIFGSFRTAFLALLPHGLIEIPAFSLAGAVAYSAHLQMAARARNNQIRMVFQQMATHRRTLPIKTIALSVVGGLLVAGLVEAHITPWLMQMV
ncbi:stage II sporulation protein M [Desulfosarcina ovata]|uniref:Stage II sporulation protein M n=1 Tax=Desulfosarcina ovata subsp. ovata TaxID=2752305 RepID=A0A5K8ADU9_9BACT|nr:stage II sporulation protein M [Desulfosarcina ovata]BBO90757.1 hypothetical protein DSCOOX_39370 [Desulfosarcina ovata subsp. ovata]